MSCSKAVKAESYVFALNLCPNYGPNKKIIFFLPIADLKFPTDIEQF